MPTTPVDQPRTLRRLFGFAVVSAVVATSAIGCGSAAPVDAASEAALDASPIDSSIDAPLNMRDALDSDAPVDDLVDDRGQRDAVDVPVDDADRSDAFDAPDATDSGDAATDAALNTHCASALVLADGARLTAQNAALATETETVCNALMSWPSLYYTAHVPAGETLAVTAQAEPGPHWRPRIRITEPCVAPTHTCLGGFLSTTSTVNDVPDIAYYRNTTGADRDVLVLVGADDASPPGLFDLAVDVYPPAPNADCANATPLTDGTTLTGQNLLAAWQRVRTCPINGPLDGPVLYYRATLPSGTYLLAQMTARGPILWNPTLRVFDDCAGTTCLGESMVFRPSLVVRNDDAAARDVIVAASSETFDSTFDLSAAIRPSPANNVCATAKELTDGLVLPNEDLRLGTESLASLCAPADPGNVLYYRATVPPGEQLAAIVRALTGGGPLQLRLLDACDATTCQPFTSNVSGAAESVVWQNTGAAPADVIVAVGSHDWIGNAPVEVHSTIAAPAYTETTIPASCDAMDTAPSFGGLTSMSTASAVVPLPFPVSFFGQSAPYFSVSWSGLLQLYPTSVGSPSRDFYMPSIPNVDGPHGFVAPFWMALGAAPEGSDVKTQTFGAAPNRRFVVEWTNWSAHAPADASRVTFQAKLFEGTDAIEFHYCRLDPATSGGTAVRVGLEDPSGLYGMRYPIDRGAVVSTSQALRYTPAL